MKACFKCGTRKPLTEFYAHAAMADGHLGKCKECAKRDVRENYAKRRAQYSAYDRRRHQLPERRMAAKASLKRTRARHPDKAKAWAAVGYAVQSGHIVRGPCEVCGTTRRVEAHHDDYKRPLDVRWLCFAHHREHGHGQIVTSAP